MSDKSLVLAKLNDAQALGSLIKIKPQLLKEVKNKNEKRWLKIADEENLKGNYKKSTDIFYSFFVTERIVAKKIDYGIKLVQELINSSNLDIANKYLYEIEKLVKKLKSPKARKRALSAIWEKRGWIADCKGIPTDEIKYFQKAKGILKSFPGKSLTFSEKQRLLTIEHFLGRAIYKNFKRGDSKNKKADLAKMKILFSNNLKNYQKEKNSAAVAFNHAWLTRVYMLQKNTLQAKKHVFKAKELFKKVSKDQKSDHILGHYERLAGEFSLFIEEKSKAADHGIKALRYTIGDNGSYYNGILESVKIIVQASN